MIGQIIKIFTVKEIRRAYLPWLIVAIFYLYQYNFRIYPNLFADGIRTTFQITAQQFGSLSGIYLLAYAILQIPLGIMVDRLGPQIVVLASIATCMLGSIFFAMTDTFLFAQLSRALMGIGSAAAFMCALKIVADHLPPGKRGLLIGLTLVFGTMGPLFAGNIMLAYVDNSNWQNVLYALAIVGAVLFFATYLFIPKQNKQANYNTLYKSWPQTIQDVKTIILDKNIVLYAILAVGLYTPLSALSDTWGATFLSQKYQLDSLVSGRVSLLLFLGLAIGSTILPWYSEKKGLINNAIAFCSFILLALFASLIYLENSILSLIFILFGIGFFSGAEMLCFTGALQFSNKNNSGEIIGVVNTLNMLAGAGLQWFIGVILDYQWEGLLDTDTGLRLYSPHSYIIALTSLMILLVVCCSLALSLRGRKKREAFAD